MRWLAQSHLMGLYGVEGGVQGCVNTVGGKGYCATQAYDRYGTSQNVEKAYPQSHGNTNLDNSVGAVCSSKFFKRNEAQARDKHAFCMVL